MLFNQIKNFFVNLFFPRKCFNCGLNGCFVCIDCLRNISFISAQLSVPCNFYFDGLIACVDYKKDDLVNKMITNFKYKFDKEIAVVLAQILKTQFVYLSQFNDFFKRIVFVPVPLHKKRLNYRGFNQAFVLAKYLIKELKNDSELEDMFKDAELIDCLRRTLYRPPQAESTRKERIENIKGVIEIDESFCKSIRNRSIFVIDDVATTCSTLNECAKILKNAGAKFVCGFVLAKA